MLIKVGDGEADHSCWQRPEDLTTARKAYKVDSSKPGSDVAGETAAALAAASLAFQPYNSSYSALLLLHAKQVWTLFWAYSLWGIALFLFAYVTSTSFNMNTTEILFCMIVIIFETKT